MRFPVGKLLIVTVFSGTLFSQPMVADELSESVQNDYDQHLGALFDHFHRNPELSSMEVKTAA